MLVRRTKNFPNTVYWVPLTQLFFSLLLGLAGFLLSPLHAVSLFLGGLIGLLGNAVFIWRFFRRENSHSPRDLLNDAYQGAFSRLLLTTLLFAIVLNVFEELNILFLFVGFIVIQMINWISPLFLRRQRLNKS